MERRDEQQQEEEAFEGDYTEGLESPGAPSPSLTIRRSRLLGKLNIGGGDAGISILCAPDGFGKTALLLQYLETVKSDPGRGVIRLIDAQGMEATELGKALLACGEELEPAMRPLVAIDNLPVLKDEELEQVVVLLRALRDHGLEVVVACRPDNAGFVAALGDSMKVGARQMTVQPREYSEWARVFSISNALDVYELTQGVPALVVQLRHMTSSRTGLEGLQKATVNLYRRVLEPMRRARDPLYRLGCFFLLVGKGSMTDFERVGMRIRQELLNRLARDYPIFGYDAETRTFCCMARGCEEMERLQKEIVGHRSAFLPKAMRMLMKANRVDDAVDLANRLLGTSGALEVIAQFPTEFALSGNAVYVHQIASRLSGEDIVQAPIGVVLAVYLSALTMGEYRLARAMCAALRRRANEIEGAIDAKSWAAAKALSGLWENCSGMQLPTMSDSYEHPEATGPTALLKAHQHIYHELISGAGEPAESAFPDDSKVAGENEIDLPRLLLACDRVLDTALHRAEPDSASNDERLQALADKLMDRRLAPFAARVRMVAATRRLLLAEPISDERAFTDAGTTAVRESDFATQLFCLLGEGWQALATNQVVNAQFRAQQVIKLADESQAFLISWAMLLERAAFVLNTSQIGIREEAELIDLSQEGLTPARSWCVALHLSAAHYDSELSAWYSLHKNLLLDARFCPLARLAMYAVGERADSIRRLLPRSVMMRYMLGDEPDRVKGGHFDVASDMDFVTIGQVNVNLFGGFRVERNGHVLTSDVWRRKKASVLAARLALVLGTFVGRRTITEELWPQVEYTRARESLYVTLSTLRSALGQQDVGPQYLLTQGDSVALNTEFVTSDTSRFDMLAREILLTRTGVSGRQVIESCLKLEQLYTGPVYVPDTGDAIFFVRARQMYLSRFVDCMLRGVDIAIKEEDLHSACWMVEAALRHEPVREDVVRAAMRVYDLSGRKREVVELYNGHLHYLEHEVNSAPDEETRQAYEEIIQRSRLAGIV